MPLNEATPRAQLIDSKLNGAGRTRSPVTREHAYRTVGRTPAIHSGSELR